MNLNDYMSYATALTRREFIRLSKAARDNYKYQDTFDNFCKRMNEVGGYGALK